MFDKTTFQEEKTLHAAEPSIGYKSQYDYEDYLKFDFDYMVELIKGKIFKMSPAPSSFHQLIAGNLHLFFGNYFKHKECSVFIAPFDVVLPIQNKKNKLKNNTVIQPDLCLICDPNKIDKSGCFGAPDLVVEILSPHTRKKDVKYKYDLYEEVGILEYWVVMPMDHLLQIFILENGAYKLQDTYTDEDIIYPSQFPDLKVVLSEVFPS